MAKKSSLSQAEIRAAIKKSQQPISSWSQLHSTLQRLHDTAWIFRGVSAPGHYLIPSIGREKVFGPYKKAQERRLFDEFWSDPGAGSDNAGARSLTRMPSDHLA